MINGQCLQVSSLMMGLMIVLAMFYAEDKTENYKSQNEQTINISTKNNEIYEIDYEQFQSNNSLMNENLKRVFREQGIVAMTNFSNELSHKTICWLREAISFFKLPEEIKNKYSPNRTQDDLGLGYERGQEQFQNVNGEWQTDGSKSSFYFRPYLKEKGQAKWFSLQQQITSLNLAEFMTEKGLEVMSQIGIASPNMTIVARMLHYMDEDNFSWLDWCGAHKDHGIFTVLLPAIYVRYNSIVNEPLNSGLYVRNNKNENFWHVHDFSFSYTNLLFQIGEWTQIRTNDSFTATEHKVAKPTKTTLINSYGFERFAMAVFFEAAESDRVWSHSQIALNDDRFCKKSASCTYKEWSHASFRKYLVSTN